MAVPDTAQALVGTFSLGVLLAASSAAFILFAFRHATQVFRDGLRLALISFLGLSSAWALTGFITTTVDPRPRAACQVSVVFSTLFDQFARYSVEQFLLWASPPAEGASRALKIVTDVLLLGRLCLGIAYIALIRPAFDPTCVPMAMIPYLAVTLIILDAVLVVFLAIRAISNGATASQSSRCARQNKSVFLCIAGLAIWMGTSVTYLLGFESIDFVFRTAIPAVGHIVLILILTLFSGILFIEHDNSRLDQASRSSPPSSRSLEAPPLRYDEIKRENFQNGAGPRFISRNADGTFPAISRPFPNDAPEVLSSTVIPQPRNAPASAELESRAKSPWQRFFSNGERRTPGATAPGRLQISSPVVHDDPNNEHNPLRRIQTIDLATAMQQDRERRMAHTTMVTSPDLIAKRPAPEPPRPSTAGAGFSRGSGSVSLKKKPLRATAPPGALTPEPLDVPLPTNRLAVETNGSSSSMQLSPGVEAMRRRSPRYPEARQQTQSMASVPNSMSTAISRETVPEIPFKFSTTPRLPPKGLPNNPRSGPRMLPRQPPPLPPSPKKFENSPAVMLVTDIVYKDPEAVRNVFHKKAKSAPILAKPYSSVMHRPRPIPRNTEDRQVFPAEVFLKRTHRRSLSSSSIMTTKSIFHTYPGNPALLPPLPEPPRSAGGRRSSAVPEKGTTRRGSIHSIKPPCPALAEGRKSARLEEVRKAQEFLKKQQDENDVSGETASNRVSAATTKESIRTMSIFGIEDSAQQDGKDDTATMGPDTAAQLDQDDSRWRTKTQSDGRGSMSTHRSQRKSSPVIPDFGQMAFSPAESIPQSATTNWSMMPAAVHMAIDMPVSKHQAHSMYIRRDKPEPAEPVVCEEKDEEAVITVMLDAGACDDTEESQEILTSRAYVPPEAEKSVEPQSPATPLKSMMPARFHRQVGDECPCFSTRKSALLKKRVPPPPPLPLSMRTRAVVIQTAEPSPLESPEEAYRMIQQQLDNLDRAVGEPDGNQDREIALLADLEREMGQQENRWQNLHNNMERGSISTFASSPDIHSLPPSSIARTSIRDSQGSLAAMYGAFLQPGGPNAHLQARPGQLASSLDYLRGNNRERLSQAEWYLQTSAQLSSRSNGTTVTKLTIADIGSPSPPDTNESDFEVEIELEEEEEDDEDFESESPVSLEDFPAVPSPRKLWQPRQHVPGPVSQQLWVAPSQIPVLHDAFSALSDVPVLARTRKPSDEPLAISSQRLWVKPAAKEPSPAGLWQKAQPPASSTLSSREKTTSRPLTIRPPRRPKRVSQLADILESPKPLPDRRGTLGIFQFPWGEKSEHPVIFQRPGRLTAMPGTMSTGASPLASILEARARQLAAQEQAMLALVDPSTNHSGSAWSPERSDDEFDENTLWEIANLLRADQVPSRDSLFPSLEDYENDDDEFDMDDYAAEFLSDEEAEEEEDDIEDLDDAELSHEFEIVSGSPVSVMSSARSLSSTEPEASLLWDKTSSLKRMPAGFGLPQPPEWFSSARDDSERPVFRHLNETIADIESASLWQGQTVKPDSAAKSSASLMWTRAVQAPQLLWDSTAAKAQTAEKKRNTVGGFGLSQPDQAVWRAYVNDDEERPVFRHLNEEMTSVESGSLWTHASIKVDSSEESFLWASRVSRPAVALGSSAASEPVVASSSQLSTSPMLWDNSIVSKSFEQTRKFGLSQPAEVTWQSYADQGEERPVLRRAKEEPANIESFSLWESPAKTINAPAKQSLLWTDAAPSPIVSSAPTAAPSTVLLWTKSDEARVSQQSHNVGLTQPEENVWAAYVENHHERPVFRHLPAEPVSVKSNSLWGLPESQPLSEEPSSFLWGGATTTTAEVTAEGPSSASLWVKTAAVQNLSSSKELLFDASINNKDRKRTSRELIPVPIARATTQRHEPLAQLATSSLWMKEASQVADTKREFWMTVEPSVPSPVVESAPVAVVLTVVSEPAMASIAALWTPSKEHDTTQASSQLALWVLSDKVVSPPQPSSITPCPGSFSRKPRRSNDQLPSIRSSKLWAAPEKRAARRSTWLGFPSKNDPASGHIAYTTLWHKAPASSSAANTTTSSSYSTTPKPTQTPPKIPPRPVWRQSSSVRSSMRRSSARVQSFVEDDFFNHFGPPKTPAPIVVEEEVEAEKDAAVVVVVEGAEAVPKLSNGTWLASFGWKKSS